MLIETMDNYPAHSPKLNSVWKMVAISFLSVLTLCLFCWLYIDVPIAEFFHQVRIFRNPSKYITTLGNGSIWVMVASVGILYGLLKENARPYINKFFTLLLSLATSGLLVSILKITIGRYRPRALVHHGIYKIDPFAITYSKCSFPSGHSQTIFAAMVSLALIFPKGRWFFLSLAFLVATTRIALTNHFLSDVLMGGYIGALMSILCYYYRESLLERFRLTSR